MAGTAPGSVTASAAERAVEAALLAGVARAAALLLHHEEQRVPVAVVAGFTHELAVPRRVAPAPLLLPGPAPEHRAALLERAPQRCLVHPRHHQHLARAGLLDD